MQIRTYDIIIEYLIVGIDQRKHDFQKCIPKNNNIRNKIIKKWASLKPGLDWTSF